LGNKLKASLWTMLLVSALFIIDRGVQGPLIQTGWLKAGQLREVPPSAGKLITPPYLPNAVVWPPGQILYRAIPTPGWWLGSENLWLGLGGAPLPNALAPYAGCFEEKSSCPEGWHLLSTRLSDGRVIYVLTKIDMLEAKRILEGLRL